MRSQGQGGVTRPGWGLTRPRWGKAESAEVAGTSQPGRAPKPSPGFRPHSQRRLGWETAGAPRAEHCPALTLSPGLLWAALCPSIISAHKLSTTVGSWLPAHLPWATGRALQELCVHRCTTGQTAPDGHFQDGMGPSSTFTPHLTPGCPIAFCSQPFTGTVYRPAPHCMGTSSLGACSPHSV